jgi:predicted Zn-dependent protease
VRATRAARALALAALLAGAAAAVAHADDAEARRARATANRIELDWPLAGSGAVATYVRRLGAKLGEAAGVSPYPWRFVVVRDRSANAFAIGGGRIYVNEGVILLCADEAEVAAILAHEMGHQLAGHFRDPTSARASDGASARIDLGAVTQEIDLAKEIEADRLGLRILADAGYDPHAALALALRLQASGAGTAPPLRDARRIDGLRAALHDVPAGGRRDSEAFRALRGRLRQPGG